MSLYRKYRPQQFTDIVGQEHVKQTLANALKSGNFSHAYLFTGPKGSGKTTTARLMAKALNCTGRALDGDGFEPCDKCVSCQEVVSGQSMDVLEIDAASNRGIDEIRDLREKIKFAPTANRYKIYVIDECHMLTKEAFNALLKTLEEPPKHAVFILATTELHKVPATILSRVQVFDFKKAKIDDIILKLKRIVKAEKINIEEAALGLIARLAYGAFRDAETMLDQVANLGKDKITLEQVQTILGQTTEKSVWELVEALGRKDRSRALEIVSEVYFEGKNLESYISQIVEILRKIILFQSGVKDQFETTKEENDQIEELAQKFSTEELVIMIEKMVEAMPKVKTSVLGQLPLEMVVFELTQSEQSQILNLKSQNDNEKLQIEKEEIIIKSESIIQKPEPPASKEKNVEKEIPNTKSQIPNTISTVWLEVVKLAKTHNNGLAAMLKDAAVNNVDEEKITLGVKYKFHADQICNQKNRKIIEEALTQLTAKNYRIECVIDATLKVKKPLDHDDEILSSAKEVFEIEDLST